MKVPASICSALLALAAATAALSLPASAGAEAANPGAGECVALAGGIYYNFTTGEVCESGSAGGGSADKGGGGGSSGETIFVHDPVQGSVYCGSFADAFVDRPQDCPNRGVKVNCSPVDGCFKCPEEGCLAGRLPNSGQRDKGTGRKKKPSTIDRHEACRTLAIDQRDSYRRYGDVYRYILSFNFTWIELSNGFIHAGLAKGDPKGPMRFSSGEKVVEISLFDLPDGFVERLRDSQSYARFIGRMWDRNSCRKFHDLVDLEQSDVYYSLQHPKG
jgi:hypothetical protein